MGYKKLIQFGDTQLLFEYEKPINIARSSKRRFKTMLERKRDRERRKYIKRSDRSIKRSKDNFFRLVHTNICNQQELPAFFTFTCFNDLELNKGYAALRLFFQRLRKHYENKQKDILQKKWSCGLGKDIAYIAVPEWQKNGNLHYHALVWGVDRQQLAKERSQRFFQRLWQRGYVDVRCTEYKSPKLAGYLAKYFSKAAFDTRLRGRRCYSASRNIDRPTETGSNELSHYLHALVDELDTVDVSFYDTVYLGRCKLTTYKK